MKVITKKLKDHLIFELEGEMDFKIAKQTALKIENTLNKMNADHLILNLAGLSYIDSSGLGSLIGILKRLGGKEKMRLCSLSESVLKVINLTGLSALFAIDDSLEDSLSVFV